MNTSLRIGQADRLAPPPVAGLAVGGQGGGSRNGRQVGIAVPAISQAGGSIDGNWSSGAYPPFGAVGRKWGDAGGGDAPRRAAHGLASQKGLDHDDAFLEQTAPIAQIHSHGSKLCRSATEARLHHERSQGHGGKRPDLLCQ